MVDVEWVYPSPTFPLWETCQVLRITTPACEKGLSCLDYKAVFNGEPPLKIFSPPIVCSMCDKHVGRLYLWCVRPEFSWSFDTGSRNLPPIAFGRQPFCNMQASRSNTLTLDTCQVVCCNTVIQLLSVYVHVHPNIMWVLKAKWDQTFITHCTWEGHSSNHFVIRLLSIVLAWNQLIMVILLVL